jgi:hypothetical protein
MADSRFTIRIGGDSREFSRTVGRVKRNLQGLKRSVLSIQGAFAGLGAALSVRAIIQASARQEQALRQLEARIKSTGGVAGLSVKQLTDMAGALQGVTAYGDEAVEEMQSLLLTFTRIQGPVFEGATRAVLDMSTVLGTDLKSSAIQVGKALNDPVKGIEALTRSGVTFTEAQKAQIKALAESGRVAEAQRIILAELQIEFGGAAEAAADTFGGALQQLGNAFGDLLEQKGGLKDAKAAIQDLVALLKDPAIVEGLNAVGSAIFKVVGVLAQGVSLIARGYKALGEGAARLVHGPLHDAYTRGPASGAPAAPGAAAPGTGPPAPATPAGGPKDEAKRFDTAIAALRKQLGLLGKTTQLERTLFEVQRGRFKDLDEAQKQALVAAARRIDQRQAEVDGERQAAAAVREAKEAQRAHNAELDQAAQALRAELDPLQAIREQLALYDELLAANKITQDEWADATLDAQEQMDKLNGAMDEAAKDKLPQLGQFGIQAARNIQSSFADFLFDPFDKGLKGMLDSFVQTVNRMAAELAAQQILKSLFSGAASAAGGSSGGGIGTLFAQLAANVQHGGGLAGTGRTRRLPALAFAGAPRYHAGGIAGLAPNEVTAILQRGEEVLSRGDPRHRANGGGISVVNHFSISGSVDRRAQEQIAAQAGAAIDRAMRRNR